MMKKLMLIVGLMLFASIAHAAPVVQEGITIEHEIDFEGIFWASWAHPLWILAKVGIGFIIAGLIIRWFGFLGACFCYVFVIMFLFYGIMCGGWPV
jgi:hypothetical protein